MEQADKIQILKDLKTSLQEKFPERIEKIFLFGSHAAGNAQAFSDYDVLILLKSNYDWRFKNEIFSVCYDIDLKYEILLDVKIISRPELETPRGRQPFIINAMQSGVSV